MIFECKLPELGDNIESGTVASILVKVGDHVEKDQGVIELETEKAVVEVPSEAAGVVTKILVAEGDDVPVGSVVVELETSAETSAQEKTTEAVSSEPKKETAPEPQQQASTALGTSKSVEVVIPDLGDGIESGTVAGLLVAVGDVVEKDQGLVELETEKAVVEVPSDSAGVVTKILVAEGDDVPVGSVVVELEPSAETSAQEKITEALSSEPKKETAPEPQQQAPTALGTPESVEVVIPDLGDGIESGTVAGLLVAVGDVVEKDQGLVELETEKAVVEVPSTVAGKVKEIYAENGQELAIGKAIVLIETVVTAAQAPQKEAQSEPVEKAVESALIASPQKQEPTAVQPTKPVVAPAPKGQVAPAAPSTRRFAREIGIDIHQVPGSGPGGRISIEDVKAWSKKVNTERGAQPTASAVAAAPLPDFSKYGNIKKEQMSKVRSVTASHLSNAWATIPHVTQFDKADITEMEALRKQYQPKAQAAGGKLTMTAILLKVIASALKVFPQFNASVDMANKEIIYKEYINIGLAVDTDRGLLVPVIRDVEKKNLVELSVELKQIAEKARTGKLSLDDMQGGNFSISNLGGIGGTYFTPIVNSPEVAILGVSRGQFEPQWDGKEWQPKLMLPLSLSYDHRLIDGADGARFIRWVCEALEQPFTMMLEG